MGSEIPIIGKNDLLSQHPILVQNFWDFKNNVKQPYEYPCLIICAHVRRSQQSQAAL